MCWASCIWKLRNTIYATGLNLFHWWIILLKKHCLHCRKQILSYFIIELTIFLSIHKVEIRTIPSSFFTSGLCLQEACWNRMLRCINNTLQKVSKTRLDYFHDFHCSWLMGKGRPPEECVIQFQYLY